VLSFAPRWRAILLIWLASLGPWAKAVAQPPLPEQQAKAAFVFNFARYVEWPERAFGSREAPVVICVLGRDVFGSALTAVENRQVQGRPIRVRVGITAEAARSCHVVFVADSEQRRLAQTLRSFAGEPILTVSDIEGFIDVGGSIGIVQGEQRLEFEVNRDALDQAQLKASSNLLKLARNLANLKGRN
jgi:hypothetical protein